MDQSTTLRSLVCLLVIFLPTAIPALNAQAYHPFPAGRPLEYAFTQQGSSDTWFLAADFDSIRTQGADTIFYFYRIDRERIWESDTTCSGDYIGFLPPPVFLVNRDHYLGQKMHYSPDGVCTFVTSDGDTFPMKTQAAPGDTWTWAPGITATVDSVVMGMVLGVPDSLKYIRLGNWWDTWIISKSHGLVQWQNLILFPGISGNLEYIDLSLSAIPALGLGHPLPGYGEVFQFDPGDKFGIEYRQQHYPGSQENDWEFHVQSLVPGTRFHYQTTREEFVIIDPGQGPNTTHYYPPAPYTWIFDSIAYAFVDLKPYQTHSYPPSGGPVQVGVHKGTDMNGRILKEYTITSLYDTCAQAVLGNYLISEQTFGEGIGETHYLRGSSGMGDSSYVRFLYCYEKGTEAWGTCLDLSGLGTEGPSDQASLTLYPNPAQTTTRIQLGKETIGIQKQIRLLHIDGREFKSYAMAENDLSFDLPLEGLPAGLYIIEVEAMGFQIHRERLVIAH